MTLFVGNSTVNSSINFNTASLFTNSTSTALFVGSNGNVGIGTTSPSQRLNVNGLSFFGNTVTLGPAGGGGEGAEIAWSAGNSSYNTWNTDVYLNSFRIFTTTTVSNGQIQIFSSNTSYEVGAYIQGNTGIGNSAPTHRLSVNGNAYFNDTVVTLGSLGVGTNDFTTDLAYTPKLVVSGLGPALYLRETDGDDWALTGLSNNFSIRCVPDVANSSTWTTPFFIGTGSPTHSLYVASNGNIGIGQSTPAYKLEIISAALGASSGNTVNLLRTNTNTGNGDDLQFLFSRNASSPTNWTTADLIIRRNVDSTAGQHSIRFNGDFSTTFNWSSTELMRITNGGNVGIGTASPGNKLSIGSTASTSTATPDTMDLGGTFRNTAGGAPKLRVWTDGTNHFGIGISSGQMEFTTTQAAAGQVWYTASTEKMRLLANGNIGIGTASPAYKLDVNGTTHSTDVYTDSTFTAGNFATTGTSGTLRLTTAFGASYIQSGLALTSGSAAPLVFGNIFATSEWARFNSSGNFGIGTTNPDAKLHVLGGAIMPAVGSTSASGIQWPSDPGGGAGDSAFIRYYAVSGESTKFVIGTDNDADDTIALYQQGADRLTVYNGNIGIGTSSPVYKLQVNGSFAATTKSFVIDHPTKPDMKLRYGSLEGPENGVYIRGRLTNDHHIEFPDYWTELVDHDTITVQLTPIGKSKQPSVGDFTDNGVYIIGKNIDCYYFIMAERKDVEKLIVEFANE